MVVLVGPYVVIGTKPRARQCLTVVLFLWPVFPVLFVAADAVLVMNRIPSVLTQVLLGAAPSLLAGSDCSAARAAYLWPQCLPPHLWCFTEQLELTRGARGQGNQSCWRK